MAQVLQAPVPEAVDAAFADLYRDHCRPVHAYLRRHTGTAAAADDLLQEVFLVAWRRHEQKPTASSYRPWLLGVAHKTLLHHWRSTGRQGRLAQRLQGQARPVEHDHAERVGIRCWMEQALRRLTPDEQRLLWLSYWAELPVADVARELGCSAAAVKTRLHRARQRLRALMAEET
jgi:RNA polymerase sigma factor (sigma-70 family)